MKSYLPVFRFVIVLMYCSVIVSCQSGNKKEVTRKFNGVYTGEYLKEIAFPMGGMGAGMVALSGSGGIGQVSVRNKPDVMNNPFQFAAIAIKGIQNGAKVLQGTPPIRDIYKDNGGLLGFPRFENSTFESHFPFATVKLQDNDIPLGVEITGWSPFTPSDEDNSSLPVAALEYTFTNNTNKIIDAVFSYHAENFMRMSHPGEWGPIFEGKDSVERIKNGFILSQKCFPDKPHYKGDFAIFTDENAIVDYCWFRGGWFDSKTLLWKDIENCNSPADNNTSGSTSASLYVPFKVESGKSKTIKLFMTWYVPHSDIRIGWADPEQKKPACDPNSGCCSSEYTSQFYEPWYSGKYKDINDISRFWLANYSDLKKRSELFSETFYQSDLADEMKEAVAANLSILKSPTVLRQKNGNLWAYEGCFSDHGCCPGSCTHVWNYAQAIPVLFPALERTLRETEYLVDQDKEGHQNFRAYLPIRSPDHGFHAAADGQLGGIMKVHREWLISGNTEWLKKLWPNVKGSFDYCSKQWDPKQKGVIEEPHHNTYDIEFWGPDGMCTSFYLGAAQAMISMCKAVGDNPAPYQNLLEKGRKLMETELFNGEYFYQKVKWEGLQTPSPLEKSTTSLNTTYSPEAIELLKKEGPKYQYGTGCLSDGVLGSWIASMCGVDEFLQPDKVKSHLLSVFNYNFKTDLTDFVNPQRSEFANGKEGGLLLCTWPKGGALSLPFVYSNEVWTGIEYQVASHLMALGEKEKALQIVREVRKRYDGRIRNPFDEYECGHWYARALSSYGMIKGLTGFFYNAVDKTLTIKQNLGENFKCFICTESGFGLAGYKNGKPFVDAKYGKIDVEKFIPE
jgi:uncharacterized protein (DUF608 family)